MNIGLELIEVIEVIEVIVNKLLIMLRMFYKSSKFYIIRIHRAVSKAN